MENVYTLNPYPLPEKPGTPEQHHRKALNMMISAVVVAAIIAVAFMWYKSSQETPVSAVPPKLIKPQSELSNDMANLLKANSVQASTEKINSMATLLAKQKTTVSTAQAETMATLLKNSSQ